MANEDTNLHWLHRLGLKAETLGSHIESRLRQRLRPDQAIHIIAYRGMGNEHSATLTGRMLAYQSADTDKHNSRSRWNNLGAAYARFDTDELPGIPVIGQLGNETCQALSDEEGYFSLTFNSGTAFKDHVAPVRLELADDRPVVIDGDPYIYFHSPDAAFGVISDVDDTILITQATSLFHMMRLTLLESSKTRVAFDGVADFYRALHCNRNPFYYVSSSPWNLYEFLTDFMRLNNFVPGPVFLRDFGIDESKFIAGPHRQHKLDAIRQIFANSPSLAFILCGDSGQDDAEIYSEIALEHPDNVLAIYIRDVSHKAQHRTIRACQHRLSKAGISLLLIPDTYSAAVHAEAQGFISAEQLRCIQSQRQTPTVND